MADRWFAFKHDLFLLRLGDVEPGLLRRVFRCDDGAFLADRDWNAAKNLKRLAAPSALSVCGAERSGAVGKTCFKTTSKKQEPNSVAELWAA